MATHWNNPVVRHVSTGTVFAKTGSWSLACANGSTNKANRQWVTIQGRGRDTIRIAVKYVNKNSDGTFTAPTTAAHDALIYPSNTIISEPISADVGVYVRAVQSGGTSGGVKCIVAEYQ